MPTRRDMLWTLPGAAAALALPRQTFGIFNGPPPLPPVVQAAINAAQAQHIVVGTKGSLNTLVQNDIALARNTIASLKTNLATVGFDSHIRTAMASVAPNNNPYGAQVVTNVHTQLAASGCTYTLSQVQWSMAQNMPSSQTSSQVSALISQGISPGLDVLNTQLDIFQGGLPGGPPGDNLMGNGFCEQFNFWAGAIGIAAISLAPGCAAPPFFVVICPAVAALGTIATVMSVLAFIFC